MPVGYGPVSRTARTLRPVAVLVLAIRSTMTWWLVSGRPRQFRVIWENSRCSILFHLLVPGGRWATVTASPVSRTLESEIFGKRLLVTDHDNWAVPEVVAGYRSPNDVESGFRQLKDPTSSGSPR